jgi:hypothetical protein
MSLLSAITSGLGKVGQVADIVGQVESVFTGGSASNDSQFNLGLPTANTFSASPSVRAPVSRSLAPLVAGGGSFGGAGASSSYTVRTGRKRRRMNPMNARAARRAIRRVKAARKMLQQIERQLPKARPSRPRSFSSRGGNTFVREG